MTTLESRGRPGHRSRRPSLRTFDYILKPNRLMALTPDMRALLATARPDESLI